MNLTTEIDEALLNNIKKFPELIVRVGDWETVAVCLRCMQASHPATQCFHTLSEASYANPRGCLHCGINQIKVGASATHYGKWMPIPHEIWRRRFIVTKEEKTGWFRQDKAVGIYEWQKIEHAADELEALM